MRQVIAGGLDVIVDRRRAGGDVRVVGVAGIERDAHRSAFERLASMTRAARIFVLDVLDDEFAADRFGTRTTSSSVAWTRSTSACRDLD